MNYKIQPASSKPAYLQLYEQLRANIVSGVYPYMSKLPSKRLIASESGVSVITAEHAYELLCDEGYAESRERSGYYVMFRENDGFSLPQEDYGAPCRSIPHPEIDQDFPFSLIAKSMRRVLSEYGELILVKSPNCGCDALRLALSRYLARSRGICAAPEQIVVGSGAEYLYGLIVEMLGNDRVYGIENPSYEKIEKVYQARGVHCEGLPLGQDGIESAALANSRASVLHITPFRSYPSGVTASASKRREYLRWASADGRFIVEDDFESEFTVSTKPEETIFSLSSGENVIYLNTFSRTISPSIRVGYMVLPKPLLPAFESRIGFYSCTVPAFVQLLLADLINRGDFERHINRVRRAKRKRM